MTHEALIQADLEYEGGAVPLEVRSLADKLSQVRGSVLKVFADNFGRSLSGEEIYEKGIGLPLVGDWQNNMWTVICHVRQSLPESVVLYNFQGTGRYMLDLERNGDFIPDFRLNFVNSVKPEVHPIIEYFNKVDVEGDQLVSRLTPTELGILNYLGIRFPDPVNSDEIVQQLWGDKDNIIVDRRDGIFPNVARLRGKIHQFNKEAFALYNIEGFEQYLLSPRKNLGKWFLPQDRADTTEECREEIRPLVRFLSQVKVVDSTTLSSFLTPSEFKILAALESKFPFLIDHKTLIDHVWGYNDVVKVECENSLNHSIRGLREKIEQFKDGDFSLYGLLGLKRSALSPKLEVGKRILPQYRADSVQEYREEIQPLMRFCSQVEVVNSERLVSYLAPRGYSLLTSLGLAFPNSVGKEALIRKVWGDDPVANSTNSLYSEVSNLRGKIHPFEDGAFDVVCKQEVGYRLASVG